ncbi:MAG: large subunit ribosomal protein [Patescibacteria group bacterium]|jgi:large subunit ribosomal protein L5|nr:large subunit ribosomal protein [Patescibacteria group bacterium]
MENLQQTYNKTLRAEIQKKLELSNIMAVPQLVKIVVNMGVKDAVADKKNIERAKTAMMTVTGQKPRVARAKKSIAAFKLRQGDPIGVVVTLRGKRMYTFLEKLNNVIFPRIKDFHGISRSSFDGRGNYTLGFSEYAVFPEVDPSTVEKVQGLEIVIVTSAKDNNEGLSLLEAMGMPFEKEGK